MKKSFLLILILVAITGCSTTANSVIDTSSITNLHEVTLEIEEMTCISCASGVEYQLSQLKGVVSAEVDYALGIAIIQYDGDVINAETIAAASDVYPASIVSDEVL